MLIIDIGKMKKAILIFLHVCIALAIGGCEETLDNDDGLTFSSKQYDIELIDDVIVCDCDITHDGDYDEIVIDLKNIKYDSQALAKIELLNADESLWSEELALPHMAWCSYYITDIKGEAYLIRYNPAYGQGCYLYSFEIFSLDNNGNEIIYDIREIDNYSVISGEESETQWLKRLSDYQEYVNEHLSQATLLISTLDSELKYYGQWNCCPSEG